MATTTTNYGFDIPQSTDLVKDGATAIATLGQDIDTAMNTALGTKKAGMVLLNTTSFSAVASQSINDVFSTTYDHYKLLITYTCSAGDNELQLRYRVAGADNSSNVYMNQRLIIENTTVSGARQDPATSTQFMIQNTNENVGEATIFNPFKTARTYFNSTSAYASGADSSRNVIYSGVHKASTSFTGFTLISASGNVTGTISVFGFNK
jgi:hypothetical protein